MFYCGYLVYQGQLNWILSIITAAGVITGITISYCVGTILENKFIIKYGSYIHLDADKMDKVSNWFRKYGNGLLIISCFIPGIRHITGYFAGITKIPYKMVCIAVVFIGLIILSAGLIQDFFANEYIKFDTITSYIIARIFVKEWSNLFHFISYLTSLPVLISIALLITIWIITKGKNRILELRFLLSTLLGGEMLEELLRLIFHRPGPLELIITGYTKYTFPSEQAFMAVIVYGFAAYIIARHMHPHWIANVMIIFTIMICILSGISPVFMKEQYPSDITAGYVFGGIWLSLNIILMEVFRILPEVEKTNRAL